MNVLTRAVTFLRKALSEPSRWGWGWGSAWWPIVHEPFSGAWQMNRECAVEDVLAFSTVQSCVSLIAGDISKISVNLIRRQGDVPDDIWVPYENTAHSPVLRTPNHFQTRNQFFESWVNSLLIHGNTYVLKQRDDARELVTALYILDPTRVKPLVADNGAVVYELYNDNLAGLMREPQDRLFVPASEIIHDRMNTFYHPLVGISPIRACAITAMQGLKILNQSSNLFDNDAQPGGVLTSAAVLSPEQVKQIQDNWQQGFTGPNRGKTAVIGADLKYQQMSFNPRDLELVSQLKMTQEMIPSCFHIPPYKVGVGSPPPYGNVQALNVQYYTDCLQVRLENIESLLDAGLELPLEIGVEFDEDSLLRMDTATLVNAAKDSIGSGGMSPNEARKRFFNLQPVTGGDSPYLQQQNYSLEALAKRDAQPDPFGKTPTPAQAQPQITDGQRALDTINDTDLEHEATVMLKEFAA